MVRREAGKRRMEESRHSLRKALTATIARVGSKRTLVQVLKESKGLMSKVTEAQDTWNEAERKRAAENWLKVQQEVEFEALNTRRKGESTEAPFSPSYTDTQWLPQAPSSFLDTTLTRHRHEDKLTEDPLYLSHTDAKLLFPKEWGRTVGRGVSATAREENWGPKSRITEPNLEQPGESWPWSCHRQCASDRGPPTG